MRHLFPILLLATACTTSKSFDRQLADATCDKAKECGSLFVDLDTCKDQLSASFSCIEIACTSFDAKVASSCLHTVRTSTCTTVDVALSTCNFAFTGCDQELLAACGGFDTAAQ